MPISRAKTPMRANQFPPRICSHSPGGLAGFVSAGALTFSGFGGGGSQRSSFGASTGFGDSVSVS